MTQCKRCDIEFKTKDLNAIYCSNKCFRKSQFDKVHDRYLNGEIHNIATLKSHYIADNGSYCSVCLLSSWQGKDIVLILDHIDGNSDNNFPSNLRLVCPNCDSQLPTFKNRNKGNGRISRRKRYSDGKSY